MTDFQVAFSFKDMAHILPEVVLTIAVLGVLVMGLLKNFKPLTAALSVIGLGVAALLAANAVRVGPSDPVSIFSGMLVSDHFGNYMKALVCIAALFVVLFSDVAKEVDDDRTAGKPEYYLLILTAAIGMCFLVSSSNLLMLYLSLEMLSLMSYLLVGILRSSLKSSEAAIKYIIYGAVASGTMLYGISLIFAVIGDFDIKAIAAFLKGSESMPVALTLGLLMTLAGFFFKVAAFPFYQWAPDVYEGAPTPITAFLSVAPKAAGMVALVRFLFTGFATEWGDEGLHFMAILDSSWPLLIAVVAAATMTVGNFAALPQKNIKRMLAYSSIAHAGFMLMAIPCMSVLGIKAILFYLSVYVVMNLGAFMAVIAFENVGIGPDLDSYKGLGGRAPFAAVALAIFLFSLTGLPPFAGFIGKVYVFAALIDEKIYWLAIVGIFNSVVSLYYYTSIVRRMFLEKAGDDYASPLNLGTAPLVLLGMLAVPTLLLGIYWAPLIDAAAKAAASLM